MQEEVKHHVYRFFNAEGSLIYIGCTCDIFRRVLAHRSKPWFDEITNITIEQFDKKIDAIDAENRYIKEENPKYNVTGTGPRADRLIEKVAFAREKLKCGEWVRIKQGELDYLWAGLKALMKNGEVERDACKFRLFTHDATSN